MPSQSGPKREQRVEPNDLSSRHDLGVGLPPGVEEALRRVGDIARRDGAELFVKGGVACYLYTSLFLGDEARHLRLRPVSADIDWTCPPGEIPVRQHLAILGAASGHTVTCTEDRESCAHIVYGSKIARGSMMVRDGSKVELDLIPTCRFAPDATRFMYEFGIEPSSEIVRTPKPAIDGVRLNSREIILSEKLGLGRGADLGKFDIVDSALLLSLGPIEPRSLKETLGQQRYSEVVDGRIARDVCRGVLVTALEPSYGFSGDLTERLDRLSMDDLKQLSLCVRLGESLAQIDTSTLERFFSPRTPPALASKLQEQLARNVCEVREALRAFATQLVG